MNSKTMRSDAKTSDVTEDKAKAVREPSKDKKTPYTWELTRIRKGRIAPSGKRFLIIKVKTPKYKPFELEASVSISIVEDEEAFENLRLEMLKKMIKQLEIQGIFI